MARLYLFCVANTSQKTNLRHIAIISNKEMKEYEDLKNSDTTFIFHKLRIDVNYIVYKNTLNFEEKLYNEICDNIKNYDKVKVINKFGTFIIKINDDEYPVFKMSYNHRSIVEYPIVSIILN